jgi:pSer/pThr/pTyr-binding forkhead associated (FHA) protein
MTTQVTLTATEGALKNQRFDFAGQAQVLIGRSPACSLRLDDPTVSRRHCLVEVGDEAAWVWDLRSLNGTIVNGHALGAWPVSGKAGLSREALCRLHDGDELRVGDTTFRVGLKAAGPASAEPEPEPDLYAMSA